MRNERKIAKYMRDQIELRPEYFDTFKSGEVNMTKLAEDAAQEFDLYDEYGDTPEEVFELACDVVTIREVQDERVRRKQSGSLGALLVRSLEQ